MNKIISGYALKGKQGKYATFTMELKLNDFIHCFEQEPTDIPPEIKRQRDLAVVRASGIERYMKESDKTYVFGGVQAVVEKIDTIEETSMPGIVKITINENTWRYLCDGQGRLGGITRLLSENQNVGNDSIGVTFRLDRGLALNRQMTADINKSPLRLPKSQLINFDRANGFNAFVTDVLDEVPLVKARVEFEKASIKKGSEKLWTLNQFKSFVQQYLGLTDKRFKSDVAGKALQEKAKTAIVRFLNAALSAQPLKDAVMGVGDVSKSIIPSAVFIEGLGIAGKCLMMEFAKAGEADFSILQTLSNVNFSASDTEWEGRCINEQGKFVAKTFNKQAIACYLIKIMGMPLPTDLAEVEANLISNKRQLLMAV